MTSGGLAATYLKQAELTLDEARHDLLAGGHGLAVRRSQEAVELSLKALLRSIGIEVPKFHDVSEVLARHAASLSGLSKEDLERLVGVSERLAEDRIPAFYGDEKRGLGPDELFDEGAARAAMDDAEWVLASCRRLVGRK